MRPRPRHSKDIPPFARQQSFPVAEFAGHVFFYNSAVADYPMPFYDGRQPGDLLAAEPFTIVVNSPWHMIAANAFDLQHFRIAHDRTLIDTPAIDHPSPFARRISALYEVSGDSLRDMVTRRFSGPQVRMTVTVWAGVNILVSAEFRRTTSYGMVFVKALSPTTTELRTIVWVPRRKNALSRAVIDPLDAAARRSFIRAFMMDDALRSQGVGYNPATLIEADHELLQYMNWLSSLTGGRAPQSRSSCDTSP